MKKFMAFLIAFIVVTALFFTTTAKANSVREVNVGLLNQVVFYEYPALSESYVDSLMYK